MSDSKKPVGWRRLLRPLPVLLGSAFIAFAVVFGALYLDSGRTKGVRGLKLIPIGSDLYITAQLDSSNFRDLKKRGIVSVFDIRPDGEDLNQTPSSSMEQVAQGSGMRFHYIPVPHETIPDSAVDELAQKLTPDAKPAVLYCRTGRRAVRLFALSEAARFDGPTSEAITKMVKEAGFDATDLKENIDARIAQRK